MADSKLHYSSRDMLALVAELNERRVADIYGRWMKKTGQTLAGIPQHETDLCVVARTLHHRYAKGNYQHTTSERDKVLELCLVLIRRHAEMEGAPATAVHFDRDAMQSMIPVPLGTYEDAAVRVMTEW